MIRRAARPSVRPPLAGTGLVALAGCALALGACASSPRMASGPASPGAASRPAPSATPAAAQAVTLPADANTAAARIARSPRHGEWQMVKVPGATGGTADSVRAWVVFPERATKAPVVLVVHEIFGLSSWVRAVADQLAAEGYVAVAPDLLTGKLANGHPDSLDVQAAVAQIRRLEPAEVQRRLAGVARWAMALPAAAPRYGIVGFCWGGTTSFEHAVAAPALGTNLGAAVVYYGSSPGTPALASVRAPVLGLYGGDDARVNATVPAADSALRALGRTFVAETYPGAGHGFLRQQDGRDGANLEASRRAWARMLGWFGQHLGG
jgi:carboxymethylenebutenolidase